MQHSRFISLPHCHPQLDIVNVGDEEDGKGDKFLRPVLVIRRFNKNLFLGVPLTKQVKENPFYFKLEVKDKIVCAMISQLRLFDSKRLLNRLEKLPEKEFEKVKREIVGKVLNFPSPYISRG